jgi:thiol:disulfide interchange protein
MKLTWSLLGLLLAVAVVCAQDTAPAKKNADAKKAIYDEKADAKALITTALNTAKRDNRRVLIQWGGNWCSWCLLLHDRFKSDPGLAKTLLYEYVVVRIDSNSNRELADKYGADLKKNGVPYLTVLDADGKVLINQSTVPFETKIDDKNGHDAKKLQEFLTTHVAAPLKAEDLLAAGLAEASKSQRKVFLRFGAPWCGWCHKLEAWLLRPDVEAIFSKDFVDVHVDIDRMPGGKEMLQRYRDSDKGGIPWFVMLDAKGKALTNSDGPKGNIGFPAVDWEIAYFVTMLNTCKSRMTEREIADLRATLEPAPKKATSR